MDTPTGPAVPTLPFLPRRNTASFLYSLALLFLHVEKLPAWKNSTHPLPPSPAPRGHLSWEATTSWAALPCPPAPVRQAAVALLSCLRSLGNFSAFGVSSGAVAVKRTGFGQEVQIQLVAGD